MTKRLQPAALSPEQARRHATTHSRRTAEGCKHMLGCRCDPPMYLRCEWMFKGERCRRGEGHLGPHEFRS